MKQRPPAAWILALFVTAPSSWAADRVTWVIAAPGYPGSTAEAQPTIDAFAAAVAAAAGWPKDRIAAAYFEDEEAGVAHLEAADAAVALVTAPFFVKYGAALALTARLEAVPKGADANERWSLVARKGSLTGPPSLATFTLSSTAGYSPAFVRRALEPWGALPAGTQIAGSVQVLSALRRASTGESTAVLLDGAQTASLPTLPFAASLEVVTRSAPLPNGLVCTVGTRLAPKAWTALEKALLALHQQPERAAVLDAVRLTHFVPLDAAAMKALSH